MVSAVKPENPADGATIETQIGEVRVCLRSDDGELTREFGDLYGKFPATGRSAGDVIQMEVRRAGRSRLGRRLYRIYGDGEEIAGPRARNEVFPFLEWGINLRVIARHSEFLQLHAASLACAGSGFLFAGGSGCGKSTLAAGLVARGWDYLCDEFALINPRSIALHPFPKAICIKAGSFPAIAKAGLSLSRRQHYLKGLKGRVGYIQPPELAGAAPVRYVILPKYAPGASPRLTPMSPGRALLELAGCMFNRACYDGEGLPILAEVVRRSRCFRLESGDLDETCTLLESTLGMISPRSVRRPAAMTGIGTAASRSPLPSRRDALRLGTRLAYVVPTVMTLSSHKAFAEASNPSGICSTGFNTGEPCVTDEQCCSGQCSFTVCQ